MISYLEEDIQMINKDNAKSQLYIAPHRHGLDITNIPFE